MFKTNTSHINMRLSFLLMAFLMLPMSVYAGNVIIETPLGNIELEMLEDDAPNTVANFLGYVNAGTYENSFMHRKVTDFIVQGGGYTFVDGDAAGARPVAYHSTIDNEFKVSNTRGTVAMARVGGQPNSATSQWFINTVDNSGSLDTIDGGYTVFARVVSGMDVVDAINELDVVYGGDLYTDLPVIDFADGGVISTSHLVMTTFTELADEPEPFVMNAGLNDAWYNPATDGQGFFITVLPTLGSVTVGWYTYDTELPTDGDTANLGDAGQRWMTLQGPIDGNTSDMTIYMTSGGLFDQASTVTNAASGTAKLTFEDCNSGTLVYDIPSINRQGSIPIQRVASDNIALCEALYAEQ